MFMICRLIRIQIQIQIYALLQLYVFTNTNTHTHMCVSVLSVCVCVCVRACVCFMLLHTHTHTHTHTYMIFVFFTSALLLDLSLSLNAPVLLYSCRTHLYICTCMCIYSCFRHIFVFEELWNKRFSYESSVRLYEGTWRWCFKGFLHYSMSQQRSIKTRGTGVYRGCSTNTCSHCFTPALYSKALLRLQ